MITENQAIEALGAIHEAGLQFPPDEKAAHALASILAQYSRSREHAQAVVSAWLLQSPEWPKPSHLHDLCTETPDPALKTATEARESCQCCGGLGYVIVERGGVSGAAKCTHESEKSIMGRL